MRDAEIERLSGILNEKDLELQDLEEKMKIAGKTATILATNLYSAMKGDMVDEFLAKYINLMQCAVPIKRLGNGYYLFGTRKIFAKIMNGKLVIRVGGGYMTIEEFIATYADQEVNRCKLLEAQQALNQEAMRASGGPGKNKSPRHGPGAGSPRHGGYSKINLGK